MPYDSIFSTILNDKATTVYVLENRFLLDFKIFSMNGCMDEWMIE
jgi:hypothetical protein